jgi:hypothetical protein
MLWRRTSSSLPTFGAAPARGRSGRHHCPSGVGAILVLGGAKHIYFYINKTLRWVRVGLGRRNLVYAKAGIGGPKLAYGFALAASTSVDSPRREFLKFVPVQWQ